MLYIYRYFRLTPMLAITILYTITLLRFLGNGPIWPSTMELFKGPCVRNWWTILLHVQNYLNADDIVTKIYDNLCAIHLICEIYFSSSFRFKCLIPSWYLSADTQLFFIAPFVIYFIHFFKLKAIFALTLSILGCIAFTISIYLIREITLIK